MSEEGFTDIIFDVSLDYSRWGPERSSSMIETVRDFKLPYGTIGDLIDHTPRDKVGRQMEKKM